MNREERFWRKVDRSGGPDACWPWRGCRFRDGYAKVTFGGRATVAHLVAYRYVHGELSGGLTLDHVAARGCTLRHCCNPAHLEPVTMRENIMRSDAPSARNARKTHCVHGHPFSGANLMTDGKRRRCRACHYAAARGARERQRQLHGLPLFAHVA